MWYGWLFTLTCYLHRADACQSMSDSPRILLLQKREQKQHQILKHNGSHAELLVVAPTIITCMSKRRSRSAMSLSEEKNQSSRSASPSATQNHRCLRPRTAHPGLILAICSTPCPIPVQDSRSSVAMLPSCPPRHD